MEQHMTTKTQVMTGVTSTASSSCLSGPSSRLCFMYLLEKHRQVAAPSRRRSSGHRGPRTRAGTARWLSGAQHTTCSAGLSTCPPPMASSSGAMRRHEATGCRGPRAPHAPAWPGPPGGSRQPHCRRCSGPGDASRLGGPGASAGTGAAVGGTHLFTSRLPAQ